MTNPLRALLTTWIPVLCFVMMAAVSESHAQFGSAESRSSTNAGKARIAVSDSGNRAMAVWQRFDGVDTVIEAAVGTVSGGSIMWGSAAQVSDSGNSAEDIPDVAISADGTSAIIVWEYSDGSNVVIQAKSATVAASSAAFSSVLTLSNTGQDAGFPSVALSANGASAVVAWNRYDGANDIEQARSITINTGTNAPSAGTKYDLSSTGFDARSIGVELSDDGSVATALFLVVDGGITSVRTASAKVSGSTASWDAAETLSNTSQNANGPDLAISSDGSLAIAVWNRSDGSNTRVEVATAGINTTTGVSTWTTGGTPISAAGSNASGTSIALSGDGTKATALWSQVSSSDTITRSASATVTAGAATFGSVTDLSATGGVTGDTDIALSDDGSIAAAVWERTVTGTSLIQGAYASVSGTSATWTGQGNIPGNSTNAIDPFISLADSATGVVVWELNAGGTIQSSLFTLVLPTATPTATPTSTPSATPTATLTATPTATPTATSTATPMATSTNAPAATPTFTPTIPPAATNTAAPTATVTAIPTISQTPAPTPTKVAEIPGPICVTGPAELDKFLGTYRFDTDSRFFDNRKVFTRNEYRITVIGPRCTDNVFLGGCAAYLGSVASTIEYTTVIYPPTPQGEADALSLPFVPFFNLGSNEKSLSTFLDVLPKECPAVLPTPRPATAVLSGTITNFFNSRTPAPVSARDARTSALPTGTVYAVLYTGSSPSDSSPGAGVRTSSTVANADGSYRFEGVPLGQYYVQFKGYDRDFNPSFISVTATSPTAVSVAPSETTLLQFNDTGCTVVDEGALLLDALAKLNVLQSASFKVGQLAGPLQRKLKGKALVKLNASVLNTSLGVTSTIDTIGTLGDQLPFVARFACPVANGCVVMSNKAQLGEVQRQLGVIKKTTNKLLKQILRALDNPASERKAAKKMKAFDKAFNNAKKAVSAIPKENATCPLK